MKVNVPLANVHCDACIRSVKLALGEVDGVTSADVAADHQSASVEFASPATEQAIRDKLKEEGFLGA